MGRAGVAQLVEQLPCKQQVMGSNPVASFRVSHAVSRRRGRAGGSSPGGLSPGRVRTPQTQARQGLMPPSPRFTFQSSVREIRLRSAGVGSFPRGAGGFPWTERAGPAIPADRQQGGVPKRSNGTDCKSVGARLRRFESSPHHSPGAERKDRPGLCGSSSVGRASAFQAEGRGFESRLPLAGRGLAGGTRSGSSVVERLLGKEEVGGSIPPQSSEDGTWPACPAQQDQRWSRCATR